LTISEIASCHTTEPVGRSSISIRGSAAVLRVVLPLRWPVAPDSTGTSNSANTSNSTNTTNSTDSTNTTDSAYSSDSAYSPARSANVAVSDEVVVVIDIDVVVTAPSAPITPPSTPEGAHSYANSERKRQSGSIVSGIIGIRVDRWSPHVHGVITRNVDHLGVSLLDDHYALLLHYLGFDLDLLVGGQFSGCRRLGTHALNSVHHLGLLCQKGVAQLGGPFDVVK